jgi:hypothetical protein
LGDHGEGAETGFAGYAAAKVFSEGLFEEEGKGKGWSGWERGPFAWFGGIGFGLEFESL